MDKRFEAIQAQMDKRFEAMDKRFEAMDKRFEAIQAQMDKRFKAMDKRFEAMDKRFEAIQAQMDKRFKAMDKRFEAMDKKMDYRHEEVMQAFKSLQSAFGKPFEQFGRNVIIRLLESEGQANVKLSSKKLKDPEEIVSKGSTEIEIDGFSLEPPIIVEITSILRNREKIKTFIKKKQLVEKQYGIEFRGFFVAATSEFTSEELSEMIVELRRHGCELINL
ncbi:MAG: hypothetical protein ACTSR8_17060 [Promethearchaeota archaeon]